jgi:hypothetical protein
MLHICHDKGKLFITFGLCIIIPLNETQSESLTLCMPCIAYNGFRLLALKESALHQGVPQLRTAFAHL